MLSRSLIYSTFIFIFLTNTVQAQTQIDKHHKLAKSNPIGRILNGDRNKQKGTLIFPGDRIHPELDKVKVLCYLNQKILLLGKGGVDDTPNKCVGSAQIKQCIPNLENKCSNTRSVNQAKISILKPYGNIILNPRPLISWQKVPGATSYTINIYGPNINWSEQQTQTTLLYSKPKSPMEPGNTYRLSVIANQGDSTLKASSTILFLLPDAQIQEVNKTISQIRSFNLSPELEARDLDAVFMSKNLLTQAIQVLEKQIDSGTNSPTLYRLLGDRYIQAGFPLKAKLLYTEAKELATKVNEPKEFQLAQDRLKSISDQQE